MATVALDLGWGDTVGNMFGADVVFGLDLNENKEKNIVKADLTLEPIPFSSEFFDYVQASHILEHIPRIAFLPERRNPFIDVMNEIWRVLKYGGVFISVTPAYPHAAAFRDPTHVNFITDETFTMYFLQPNAYGFSGAFELIRQNWHEYSLITIMRKVAVVK